MLTRSDAQVCWYWYWGHKPASDVTRSTARKFCRPAFWPCFCLRALTPGDAQRLSLWTRKKMLDLTEVPLHHDLLMIELSLDSLNNVSKFRAPTSHPAH